MKRHVHKTEGVYPLEIHLAVRGKTLDKVRFVGGGCAGQARLSAKLLAGRPVAQVRRLARGIPCREGTSCPDRLARAVVFASTRRWQRARLGGVEFVNAGPLAGRGETGSPRLELALVSAGKRGLTMARRSWAALGKTYGVNMASKTLVEVLVTDFAQ